MYLSSVALIFLLAGITQQAEASAECCAGCIGEDDVIITTSKAVLTLGGWEDAAIWSTDKIVIDAGDGVTFDPKSADIAAPLYKMGGGNDVLIGGKEGKYGCKIKYGVQLVGNSFEPAGFFAAKAVDGLGPVGVKDPTTGVFSCSIDSAKLTSVKIPKGFKPDCLYLYRNGGGNVKCEKKIGGGGFDVNGKTTVTCPPLVTKR